MYRQGLGDCFLITFNVGSGDGERHMLIDCGTLGSTTTGVSLQQVAQHVDETIGLGQGRLHLVVATHEHWDHLSGFTGPMQRFKGRVDRVWLAWTENPDDPDAQAFGKGKRDLGEALAAVAAAAPAGAAAAAQIWDLLGFVGMDVPLGADAPLAAAKLSENLNAAMEFVRKGLGAPVTYHNPGDLVEEPWLPGFRFYVLGPPRDKESIKDLGKHGSDELYGVAAGLRASTLALDGAAPTAAEQVEQELQFPFDRRFQVCGQALQSQRYPDYFDPDPDDSWRKIDEDWLSLASDLALQLDSLTNNSSLALAIERTADSKVLLFPADAQQGNWLSWHAPALKWTVPAGPAGPARQVTAADLLARTVFYKVGHHSSHNATVREKGLELMKTEAELTAFIPVDRAVALNRNPKDSWQMPARPLYRRLLEKCQGRVARSDIGWAGDTAAANQQTEQTFLDMATEDEWTAWRTSQGAASHVRIDPLFVEYVLE